MARAAICDRLLGRTPAKYAASYMLLAVVGGSGSWAEKDREVMEVGKKPRKDVDSEHSTCLQMKSGTFSRPVVSTGSRGVWTSRRTSDRESTASSRIRSGRTVGMMRWNQDWMEGSFQSASEREM